MIFIKAFLATFGVMLGLIAFVFAFNLLGKVVDRWKQRKRWKRRKR